MCADYKDTNLNTMHRGCSIPNIHILKGKKYYAKLDLTMGYHQCLVEESCRWMLAINTICGKFEFIRVPFGPQQAPGYFQDVIGNYVFPDFDDKNLVYFDDKVVFGDTFKEYLHNLEVTLDRLIEVGMVLRPSKSSFVSESVE